MDDPNVNWEYTAIEFDTDSHSTSNAIKKANELGEAGWELVISSGYKNKILFFKRRKQ